MRRYIFITLAVYILAAPALPQFFGLESPIIRPWKMYSGVGVGIPKDGFVLTQANGGEIALSPLEVLGQQTYPDIRHYDWTRTIYNKESLRTFAAEFCAALKPGEKLSFDGRFGWWHGYRRMTSDDVCGGGVDE